MDDPFEKHDISPIGLGTYLNFDPDQCQQSVEIGLEMGYRHLDTAQFYTNERYVGRAMANAPLAREDIFVATKVWQDHLYPEGVLSSTEGSLEKLGVSCIDLLYVHWPAEYYEPDSTLGAFNQLVDEGKVDYIGVSNFTLEQWKEANEVSERPILANQVEMHPLLPQNHLQEYAEETGSYLVAYAPLGQGRLLDDPVLTEIAEENDATTAQVCLAWLIQKPNVIAIPKATGRDHLQENLDALDLELDPEHVERIDNMGRQERFIRPCFGPWEEGE